MGVRIALFGQPRVLSEDGTVEYSLPRKTSNLLGYVILHRRRPVERDSLAFALFPDEEEDRARASLRRNLLHLLAAFPGAKDLVLADNERIAWNGSGDAHVDVIAFEEAAAAGRHGDALAEYSGDLLPTIYDEWTVRDRERLRDVFHDALFATMARERSERRYDAATATAHRLLESDPWREDVVRELMAVRYESGDRAGALAAFERFATQLRDEMRAEPMPETIAVRDAVLRGARLATTEVPRKNDAAPSMEPTLPFVGRSEAIERAREMWRNAADGNPSVLFVLGEAGVGKSRFATELARMVEREGARVVRGYTSAGGEHRPYEAFVDALRGAPDLLDEHAGATLTDDRAARLRLFDSVGRRLQELSRSRPLVVILEDLHWAGPSTVDLLDFVVSRAGRSPLLFVATLRSEELAGAHALSALRRHLRGRGNAGELVLGRISATDATQAARAVLAASVDDETLARAVAWVDGIPLLLVEAVRELAAGRSAEASDIASLVGERLERLTPAAETAAFFGAILGERFDLEAIGAAAGWHDEETLDAIGELVEGGLVRATARAPALNFAFTHDLIRVAALERMLAPDRARAHGMVARALLSQNKDRDAEAAAVARHFEAAGERRRAAEQFRRAARYALNLFANEDARANASAGLALYNGDDAAWKTLRYELVDLREQSFGRIGATQERRADAHLLAELARGEDDEAIALDRVFEAYLTDKEGREAVLARLASIADSSTLAARTYAYALAKHAFRNADFQEAHDAAKRAADAFERDGDSDSAMRARFIAIKSLKRMGEFDEAQAETERLRPLAEAGSDLTLRREFYQVASDAFGPTHPAEALEDARRALECALRIGDRWGEALARHNIGSLLGAMRRYAEALDEDYRSLAAYRDVGDRPGANDLLLNIVARLMQCGDYAGASAVRSEVEDAAAPWVTLRSLFTRMIIETYTDQLESAVRTGFEAKQLAQDLGATFYYARIDFQFALVYAMQSRSDEAKRAFETTIEQLQAMSQPEQMIEALAFFARLLATTGEPERAREIAERVAEHCKARRVEGYSEIAWNLAATYKALGDDARARGFAEEAAAGVIDDAMYMPADLAEIYLAQAWIRDIIDYLWERPVRLELGTAS